MKFKIKRFEPLVGHRESKNIEDLRAFVVLIADEMEALVRTLSLELSIPQGVLNYPDGKSVADLCVGDQVDLNITLISK